MTILFCGIYYITKTRITKNMSTVSKPYQAQFTNEFSEELTKCPKEVKPMKCQKEKNDDSDNQE